MSDWIKVVTRFRFASLEGCFRWRMLRVEDGGTVARGFVMSVRSVNTSGAYLNPIGHSGCQLLLPRLPRPYMQCAKPVVEHRSSCHTYS